MIIKCDENTNRYQIMKNIKHLMLEDNLKNVNLIEKLGMSEQGVSNLLNPNYRSASSIQLDNLYRIADALGYELYIEFKKKE